MADATGHRGFFYHFLDLISGRRASRSELSTMDTAILVAGALTAAAYFDRSTACARSIARGSVRMRALPSRHSPRTLPRASDGATRALGE